MIGRKYPREFYLRRIQKSQPVYKFSNYAGMDPVAVEDPSKFDMGRESDETESSGNDGVNVTIRGKALLTERNSELEDDTIASQEV